MKHKLGKKVWVGIIIFSLLGQIAWTMENMLLNSFISNMFNATLSDIALMVSLSAIAATLTTLIMGALSDKVGKRKLFICGGYIVWGISIAAFCLIKVDLLTSWFPYANAISLGISLTILLDCIMTFFGSSANDACFNAYLTDISDETNRGKIEGVNSAMPLISVLIVFGVFGSVTSTNNWDFLFLAIGAIVLVGGLVGLGVLQDSPNLKPRQESYFKNIIHGFRPSVIKANPALYMMLLIFSVFSIAVQVYMPYLIIYFTKTLAMDNYVLVFAPAIIVAAVCTVFFGRFYDKKGFKKTIFYTLSVFMVGLILLYVSKSTIFVFIGCMLMMTGWLTTSAACNASIRQFTPKKDVGLYQGIRIFMAVLVPMLIGPWIGSSISGSSAMIGGTVGDDYIPSALIFIGAAAVNVITYILVIVLLKKIFTRRQKLTSKHHNDDAKHLDEYPRGQLKRNEYLNLNTTWDFAISRSAELPSEYSEKIEVPYCVESQASKINRKVKAGDYLYYRLQFNFNLKAKDKVVLLHFDGVDNLATIYLNGHKICEHEGGYLPFSVEIQDYLEGSNTLVVQVLDGLDYRYPYGKQSEQSQGMWYTEVSGIYKPVWIEVLGKEHIENVRFKVNTKAQKVEMTLEGSNEDKLIVVSYNNQEVYRQMFKGDYHIFTLNEMHLWSPDEPNIYEVMIKTKSDEVHTYFACRDIKIQGKQIYLNERKIFINGLLYQPYFAEGLLTPESYEAYYDDIMLAKECGFNTLRVHVSLPLELFYETCDRVGMLVIQDMVNNTPYSYFKDTVIPYIFRHRVNDYRDDDPVSQGIFVKTMIETVKRLNFYPCIIMWTIFNEGWGQFNSKENYEILKELDNTRLIDVDSGWFDVGVNPLDSLHIYFKPLELVQHERPLFVSECGGFSYKIDEHSYNKYNTYGYRFYYEQKDFEQGLIDFYTKEVGPGIEKGLVGVIYTELCDVEDETNGLVTFDRQIVKIDKNRVSQAIKQALGK
ncbi:MAG: MFS transporter [Bacilli bacterium]|nr:MFS transporter [Bacilli bacterium]